MSCFQLPPCSIFSQQCTSVSFMMLVTMLADAYRILHQKSTTNRARPPVSSTGNSSAKPAVHCQRSTQRQAAISKRRPLMATVQSGILISERYGSTSPSKGTCTCTLMVLRLPACQQLFVCLSALRLRVCFEIARRLYLFVDKTAMPSVLSHQYCTRCLHCKDTLMILQQHSMTCGNMTDAS